jgi:TPR repeat protein
MGKTVGEWSVIAKAGGHSRDITEAQLYMGLCYYWGFGVVKNADLCAAYISTAAKSNNDLTELAKGICFFGVAPDMNAAVAIFQKYAYDGNALAQHELGLCSQNPKTPVLIDCNLNNE